MKNKKIAIIAILVIMISFLFSNKSFGNGEKLTTEDINKALTDSVEKAPEQQLTTEDMNNALKKKETSDGTHKGPTSLKSEQKYNGDREMKTESSDSNSGKHTLSQIISDANDFLKNGNEDDNISTDNMQKMSNTIYNILFILGTILAVIMGGILGIKFMTSGLEGKAEVKEMLMPYIVGCIVLFGSFTIWKIVVTIFNSF